MGKDLKGKELGVGISQRSDGFYVAGLPLNTDSGNRNYSINAGMQTVAGRFTVSGRA